MGQYFDEMKRTMEWLASRPDTIFLGQAVGCGGTFLSNTLTDVAIEKRLEVPVSEQLQMQLSIGLALGGQFPISIYPRQNFLLLALGDLVNMLDKLPAISDGTVVPPLVVRTAVGTTGPIHPGHQHVGNYADAFRSMLTTVDVVELNEPADIFPAYERVYAARKPAVLIEFGDYYAEK